MAGSGEYFIFLVKKEKGSSSRIRGAKFSICTSKLLRELQKALDCKTWFLTYTIFCSTFTILRDYLRIATFFWKTKNLLTEVPFLKRSWWQSFKNILQIALPFLTQHNVSSMNFSQTVLSTCWDWQSVSPQHQTALEWHQWGFLTCPPGLSTALSWQSALPETSLPHPVFSPFRFAASKAQ